MSRANWAGSGQHSHQVPLNDGAVVEIRDRGHMGTAIYWSEAQGRYAFVSYDRDEVRWAQRVLLIRGLDVEEALSGDDAYGCDLDSPDGLVLLGCDLSDDPRSLLTDGAVVLWDSAAEVAS